MDGRTIRRTREYLGETQGEFAKRFGVHQTSIAYWERVGLGPNRKLAREAMQQIMQMIKKRRPAAR